MLLSLMLFCGKFITVYVCQKLLKYSLVWQTYGKNKTVQFFLPHSVDPESVELAWIIISRELPITWLGNLIFVNSLDSRQL